MRNIFTSECIKQKCSSVFTLLLRVDQLPLRFQREPWEFPVAVVGSPVLLMLALFISLSLATCALAVPHLLWPFFDSLSSGMLDL